MRRDTKTHMQKLRAFVTICTIGQILDVSKINRSPDIVATHVSRVGNVQVFVFLTRQSPHCTCPPSSSIAEYRDGYTPLRVISHSICVYRYETL
jgi:hypothetical protein